MLKHFINFLIILYIIITMIIFLTDFYYYLIDRYSRYHIGRWDNDEWQKAIEKICIRWSKRTPTVKLTDNKRFILLDMINGKYRNNTIQSWQIASILLGLYESNNVKSKNSVKSSINKILTKDGNWKYKPKSVDCGMLSYAILKSTKDVEKIKPAMDYMVYIIEKNICNDGMVTYTNNIHTQERYVDTLGFICPFLMLYSKCYSSPKHAELALGQISSYNKFGLLENTYIPNHAFSSYNKLPLGVFGWGRGVAWYVISLIDTYLEMDDVYEKEKLKLDIKNAADSYLKYQRKDGGFGCIIQNSETYDSSITAVLSYFYSKCYDIFGKYIYLRASNRCLEKLKSVTKISGKIDLCQGDTKGIGVHSQTFDIMPFAQGFALRTILINEGRDKICQQNQEQNILY